MQHAGRGSSSVATLAVRRLGFTPASTMDDALEMATDTVGPHPTITHLHTPPLRWRTCSSGRRSVSSAPPDCRPRSGPARPRTAVRSVRRTTVKISRLNASVGFPYRRPTAPRGVVVPPSKPTLGADYETDWARRRPARCPLDHHQRSAAAGRQDPGRPEVGGIDRLADLRALTTKKRDDPPAVIFTPNHHSHLDTPLAITAIPEPWRGHLVVGAAADYFFTTHVTSAASALVLNAFPVARNVTGRQTADLARDLIEDGWSLVLFPEGGRSPRRLGPAVQGRRGVPLEPHRRRWCRCSSRARARSSARA